jgi:hypothetical protein
LKSLILSALMRFGCQMNSSRTYLIVVLGGKLGAEGQPFSKHLGVFAPDLRSTNSLKSHLICPANLGEDSPLGGSARLRPLAKKTSNIQRRTLNIE